MMILQSLDIADFFSEISSSSNDRFQEIDVRFQEIYQKVNNQFGIATELGFQPGSLPHFMKTDRAIDIEETNKEGTEVGYDKSEPSRVIEIAKEANKSAPKIFEFGRLSDFNIFLGAIDRIGWIRWKRNIVLMSAFDLSELVDLKKSKTMPDNNFFRPDEQLYFKEFIEIFQSHRNDIFKRSKQSNPEFTTLETPFKPVNDSSVTSPPRI